MQKIRGFCEPQNFLPAKISDNKVGVKQYSFKKNAEAATGGAEAFTGGVL